MTALQYKLTRPARLYERDFFLHIWITECINYRIDISIMYISQINQIPDFDDDKTDINFVR